jgi:hypothetical protein
MMKNLIIIGFVLVSFAAMAQEKKVTWDYPVKPGMEEWNQFKSMNEMFQACQIPENILKQLDTESLVDICFNFPAYGVLFFYNTPQLGFDNYYSNFNGIRELLNRKNVGSYLLKKYANMSFDKDFNPLWTDVNKGRYVFKIEYFETILAQPQVVNSLTVEERQNLLKETLDKLEIKISRKDLFGGKTLVVNTWILAQVLDIENKLSSRSQTKESLKTGLLDDYDLELIYQQAKNYKNE